MSKQPQGCNTKHWTQVSMWARKPQKFWNTEVAPLTDRNQRLNIFVMSGHLRSFKSFQVNICTSTSMVFYQNCKPQPGIPSRYIAYTIIGELVRAHNQWFPLYLKSYLAFLLFKRRPDQLETLKQRNKVQNHKSHHSNRGTAEFCCTNLSLTTSGS